MSKKQTTAPSSKVSLLDARSANEFAERGHTPTALNANRTESEVAGSSALKSEAEMRKLLKVPA